jgi:hypothetical protein
MPRIRRQYAEPQQGQVATLEVPLGYRPRPYQLASWSALDRGMSSYCPACGNLQYDPMETLRGKNCERCLNGIMGPTPGGSKRHVYVIHRKGGKDIDCFAKMIKHSVQRKGAYYYYFPTAAWGRKALWEMQMLDGRYFLDLIPKEAIVNKNDTEMMLKLAWDSTIRIMGTDNLKIVGPGPVGVAFSEYSLQTELAWQFIQPILRFNRGWALFNGTPRGKRNCLYRIMKSAQSDTENWYWCVLTIKDTCDESGAPIIREEDIDRDVLTAQITREFADQEYYCNFCSVLEGAYYAEPMALLEKDGRVGTYKYNRGLPVYTVWDPGYTTAVWFFQSSGGPDWVFLRSVERHGWGFEKQWPDFILRECVEKYGYRYAAHFAPLDTERNNAYKAVKGKTLVQIAAEQGLKFTILPFEKDVVGIGIPRTRQFLYRCYFDEEGCEDGLEALAGYKDKQGRLSTPSDPVFLDSPIENACVHLADAMRYASLAVTRICGSRENPEAVAEHRKYVARYRRPV